MSFIIGEACVNEKDGACIDACPIEDCIQEADKQMYINPETCIECGACVPVCPVDAIYEDEEEATDEEGEFIVHENYNFFNQKYKS